MPNFTTAMPVHTCTIDFVNKNTVINVKALFPVFSSNCNDRKIVFQNIDKIRYRVLFIMFAFFVTQIH